MENMGNQIKRARQLRGLSQEELGKAIGTTKSAVSKYELGHREPSFSQLRQIADALNVTIGYLQGYDAIDAKEVMDAAGSGDFRTLEKLLGMPDGSIMPVPPEEAAELEKRLEQEQHESELNLNKIRFNIKLAYDRFTEQDYILLRSLIRPFSNLNHNGQQEAVKRVEELTEIPRYRAETTPQSPPAPQEGKDTTPPPDAPQRPQEDES